MKLNTFLAINAVVGLAFGVALLLAPAALLNFNGVQTDRVGLVLARLFGAEFVGFNIVTWLVRNYQDGSGRRVVVLGHTISESLGFVVAILAKLGGLGNAMFWGIVAVYLVFALGYAYFQFTRPQSA